MECTFPINSQHLRRLIPSLHRRKSILCYQYSRLRPQTYCKLGFMINMHHYVGIRCWEKHVKMCPKHSCNKRKEEEKTEELTIRPIIQGNSCFLRWSISRLMVKCPFLAVKSFTWLSHTKAFTLYPCTSRVHHWPACCDLTTHSCWKPIKHSLFIISSSIRSLQLLWLQKHYL